MVISSKWRSDWQFVGQKLLVRTPLTDICCYFWGVKYIEKCQNSNKKSGISRFYCFDKSPTAHIQAVHSLIIVFVYKINDNFHHNVFFLCPALGYHKREGYKGVVC